MNKLIDNKELYNYLENNYTKTYYRFEKIFGKMFPYKKLGQQELNEIKTLKLVDLKSTSGIDELKNLEDLHVINVSKLTDLDNILNLKKIELSLNSVDIDVNSLISISKMNNLNKMELYGKSVKNITVEQSLEFSDKTFISYNQTGLLTPEEFSKVQKRIGELKLLITPEMTEIEKVKIIYKNMLRNDFEYDYNSNTKLGNKYLINNTLYGPLVENKGVCPGISAALEATLENVGLEAHSCGGWLDTKPSAGNSHQWNQVKVDGEWYNLDLTNDFDKKSWRFFMKSDKDIDWIETHYCDKTDKYEKINDCNSIKYDELYREDSIEREKRILKEQKRKLELESVELSNASENLGFYNEIESLKK